MPETWNSTSQLQKSWNNFFRLLIRLDRKQTSQIIIFWNYLYSGGLLVVFEDYFYWEIVNVEYLKKRNVWTGSIELFKVENRCGIILSSDQNFRCLKQYTLRTRMVLLSYWISSSSMRWQSSILLSPGHFSAPSIIIIQFIFVFKTQVILNW